MRSIEAVRDRAHASRRAARARAHRPRTSDVAGSTRRVGACWPRPSSNPRARSAYPSRSGAHLAPTDFDRARSAFERAAVLAQADRVTAERVARERLRLAEEHGDARGRVTAIDGAVVAAARRVRSGRPGRRDRRRTRRIARTAIRLELIALRRRQAQLARIDAPEQVRGSSCSRRSRCRPASRAAARSDRARRGARALRRARRARAELAGRRRRPGSCDVAVDPARRCVAARRPARSGARTARIARGEGAGLCRADVGGGARRARPHRRRGAREDVSVRRARRSARHVARTRPAAHAGSHRRRDALRPGGGAARVRGLRDRCTRSGDLARRGALRARQGARGRAELSARARSTHRARRRHRQHRRGARTSESRSHSPRPATSRAGTSNARSGSRARTADLESVLELEKALVAIHRPSYRSSGASSRRSRSSAATTNARSCSHRSPPRSAMRPPANRVARRRAPARARWCRRGRDRSVSPGARGVARGHVLARVARRSAARTGTLGRARAGASRRGAHVARWRGRASRTARGRVGARDQARRQCAGGAGLRGVARAPPRRSHRARGHRPMPRPVR